MLGFLVTVSLLWIAYKLIKTYINAKSQIRSQEYGKEARYLAINEYGVSEKYYNYIVQNSMDVLKETALDMRESIFEYKDVSWPRMLAWTIYVSYLNMCKGYLNGDNSSKAMVKVFGLSNDEIIRAVSLEILDPFKSQILHNDISFKVSNVCANDLLEWQKRNNFHIFKEDLTELKSQRIIQQIENHDLENLPESISCLESLEEISIHYCYEFKFLPKSITELKSLKKIELYECLGFENVPEYLGFVPNLKSLNLSGLPISYLPETLGNLSKLEELCLDNFEEVISVGDFVCNIKSLKKLSISGCSKLKCLPDCIGELTKLEELYISNNIDLHVIPDSISKLKNLRILDILRLNNAVLPKEAFRNLSQLKSLEIDLSNQYNREVFKSGFNYLKNLEFLRIYGCDDDEYFESLLNSLPSLKELKLVSCDLNEFPKVRTSINKLSIHGSMRNLVSSLSFNENLISLSLSGDQGITTLPENIESLKYLKELKISFMENLISLPNGVMKLHNLETLELMYLKSLENLQSEIRYLINLKDLKVTGCDKLKKLPEELALVPDLKTIIKGWGDIEIPVQLKAKVGLEIKNY